MSRKVRHQSSVIWFMILSNTDAHHLYFVKQNIYYHINPPTFLDVVPFVQ